MRIFAAGAHQELDLIMEAASPDVVVDWSRSRGPFAGVYDGRDAVRDFFGGAIDVWDELEYFQFSGDLLTKVTLYQDKKEALAAVAGDPGVG